MLKFTPPSTIIINRNAYEFADHTDYTNAKYTFDHRDDGALLIESFDVYAEPRHNDMIRIDYFYFDDSPQLQLKSYEIELLQLQMDGMRKVLFGIVVGTTRI